MAVLTGIRKIIVFILIFLASLFLCVSVILMTLGSTLLDKEYMKQEINDNDLYTELTDSIKSMIAENYRSSTDNPEDLNKNIDKIIDASIDAETVRKEFEAILDKLYDGEDITVDGTYFRDYYSGKISSFCKEQGYNVEEKDVSELIDLSIKTAKDGVDVKDDLDKISAPFSISDSVTALYIVLGILALVFTVLILIFSRDRLMHISLALIIAGAVTLIASVAGKIFLSSMKADDNVIAKFILSLANRMVLTIGAIALIYIVVAVVLLIIRKIVRKKAA